MNLGVAPNLNQMVIHVMMNRISDTLHQDAKPSTAKTVVFKTWKHTKARDVTLVVGDFLPAVIGLGAWLTTGSIMQGVIWGGASWLVCSYLLLPILSGPWLVAPSTEEFRTIIRNFCYNGDNTRYIYMAVGTRRFKLYCEITEDETDYIGLILPRKYWDDIFDDTMRKGLKEFANCEIIESEKNIYVRGSSEVENAVALVEYLMKITDTSLNEFSSQHHTSYGVHVFSDLPPSSIWKMPHDGVKKK